jgi:FAD/FMN-containing dehydrogenase
MQDLPDMVFLVTKLLPGGQRSLQVAVAKFRSEVLRAFPDTEEGLYLIESHFDLQIAELEARIRLVKAIQAISEHESFAVVSDEEAARLWAERDRAQEALDEAEGRVMYLEQAQKLHTTTTRPIASC